MKRLLIAAVCSFALCSAAAVHADATHLNGGLGFHESSAPIGVRWWLSDQKVGIDAAIGFSSTPSAVSSKDKEKGFTLDVGVPWVLKSWDGCHVMFRPGLLYRSQEIGFDSDPITAGVQFDTEKDTQFAVQGEIEAEVFLRDNVSVSAAHGIRFTSENPPGPGDNLTEFSTTGNNFTTIGFHVYIFGAK